MDTKKLVEKLHAVFCEENKESHRYSKVWLSDVDFGGMYQNDKYVLNVKAEHNIESCNQEIIDVIDMLNKKAPNELKMVWSVAVYNADDNIHCYDEVEVYTLENAKC